MALRRERSTLGGFGIGRAAGARRGQSACMPDYRATRRRWESTALTVRDIVSIPDAELDDWLWTRLCRVVGAGSAASIGALPQPQQAYFATRLFEWEVMNGGFHQYFFNNPEPELLDLVLDGYRLLGLEDQATVVREVVAPLAEREAGWRDSLRGGTIETFMVSYVDSALPEFDDRVEAHDAERIRFVRSQPDAFAI
jgi:Domain of unknown function (DUF4375)